MNANSDHISLKWRRRSSRRLTGGGLALKNFEVSDKLFKSIKLGFFVFLLIEFWGKNALLYSEYSEINKHLKTKPV